MAMESSTLMWEFTPHSLPHCSCLNRNKYLESFSDILGLIDGSVLTPYSTCLQHTGETPLGLRSHSSATLTYSIPDPKPNTDLLENLYPLSCLFLISIK